MEIGEEVIEVMLFSEAILRVEVGIGIVKLIMLICCLSFGWFIGWVLVGILLGRMMSILWLSCRGDFFWILLKRDTYKIDLNIIWCVFLQTKCVC